MTEDIFGTPVEPGDGASAELRLRDEQAMGTVKNYVIGAMGASLIPAPLLDVAAVSGVQLAMLNALSKKYGIPFSENVGKSVIASLMGGVGAGMLSRPIYLSVVKVFPGLGTLAGLATMPVVAGGLTWAIGKVFVQHFSSGGTFLNFNPEKVREYFQRLYEDGKTVASGLAGGQRTTTGPAAP
jgi:uncharacterized protein (DUF697 family)